MEENPEYNNFLFICNTAFNNYCSSKNEKLFNLYKLLMLFFNIENYNNKIKPVIINKKGIVNPELLEIVLYGFRFCAQTLNLFEGSETFYSLLFQKDYLYNLEKSYVPGNDYIDNYKLNSLVQIEDHLMKYPDDIGCYVCSCGFYYSIDPCGFPTEEHKFKCPECQQDIGYGKKVVDVGVSNHGMVIRPGHYRIFKDLKQKEEQMTKYDDCDENIPNRTLEQYKKEVIEPILNESKYSINRISKNIFIKKDKNIRGMSQITYRLLNFLLYSHLFYANCLDYIKDEQLKNYLHENMKCIDIMKKDWELLKEALEIKNITFIQIFLNLIFKRLSGLIKKCNLMNKQNDRDEFEKNVENLVLKCIEEYPDYEKKYLEINQINLDLNIHDIKTIVSELFQPTEEIYPHKDYPYLKYFIYTKYRTMDDLLKMLGPEKEYSRKYPLLHQYLQDNTKTKKLKYLPAFNDFTNYIVNYYSCQISRQLAKDKLLKDAKIMNEQGFNDKLKEFKSAWGNIKNYATKYKCKDTMKPKSLDENDSLIYFLNDDGELGYGMYLAAACQNFIEWQNNFLQPIIDSENQSRTLNYYIRNLNNKVPVQDAMNEILLIDNFGKSEFNDFNDILYTFSRRNIFNSEGEINYLKYNSFKFDFSSIEEELGEIFLPGKCLFEDEDHLNFMSFWGEGFRGGKSDTLSTFYLKYKQVDLTEDEINSIIKYIKKTSKNNNINFTEFFGSLNLLIFHLEEKREISTKPISTILLEKPPYLKISNDCLSFFQNEGNQLGVNKLMNIFFYIEHLCFNDLCKNLQPDYKINIPHETEEKIKNKLLKEKKKEEKYSIKDLAAALRRFISRYLVGNRQDIEIDQKRELYFELTRLDLWEEKYGQLVNLEELIKEQLGEFKLNVGQAFALYEIIGDEDKKYIKEIEISVASVSEEESEKPSQTKKKENPETLNNAEEQKEDSEEPED